MIAVLIIFLIYYAHLYSISSGVRVSTIFSLSNKTGITEEDKDNINHYLVSFLNTQSIKEIK